MHTDLHKQKSQSRKFSGKTFNTCECGRHVATNRPEPKEIKHGKPWSHITVRNKPNR